MCFSNVCFRRFRGFSNHPDGPLGCRCVLALGTGVGPSSPKFELLDEIDQVKFAQKTSSKEEKEDILKLLKKVIRKLL